MKSKIKTLIHIFLGIWIIFSIGIYSYSLYIQIDYDLTSGNFEEKKQPSTSTVYHEPYIHIWDNWSATAAAYPWCTGDGSWTNPYTIENVIINATNSPVCDPLPSSDFSPGILINSSLHDYFVLKNCTVFTSDPYKDVYGIWLFSANNGTLIDNDFSNCSTGIFLYNAQNSTIIGNIANNNYNAGINMIQSIDCSVSGNFLYNNHFDGIDLEYCERSTIYGNTIENNGVGIESDKCNNTIISGNTLKGNSRGLMAFSSGISPNYNITVIGNTVEYNNIGLSIYETHNGEIKDNTIQFSNSDGFYLDKVSNIIISNNTIFSNGYGGYAFGLRIEYSEDCEISMNTMSNNSNDGMRMDYCSYIKVSNNIVDDNDQGIILYQSDYNNITDNTIRGHAGEGIELTDSNYNRVTGNTLRNNNGGCIIEKGTCVGNIIENNDCGGQQPIPGFNLYIIVGLIGIISVILMRRRFKN